MTDINVIASVGALNQIAKIGPPVRARRDPKNKVKKEKKYTKKPKQVTSHVFAETTHVIAAPYGFARVVTNPT